MDDLTVALPAAVATSGLTVAHKETDRAQLESASPIEGYDARLYLESW